MQPVDLTTLRAVCAELRSRWLPARLEQVYQRDRATIALALRTLKGRDWLTLSWHPQAARVCIDEAPPRTPDTFTFSDQLRHQLQGLALTAMPLLSPWERVIDFQFASRPGDSPLWHLYAEIMGKYSNVILTDAKGQIITAAHQVSPEKSSLRPIQTGQLYDPPPSLTGSIPDRAESQASWQERVSLIPRQLKRQLLESYRGLGPNLVTAMIQRANLDQRSSAGKGSSSELGSDACEPRSVVSRWGNHPRFPAAECGAAFPPEFDSGGVGTRIQCLRRGLSPYEQGRGRSTDDFLTYSPA